MEAAADGKLHLPRIGVSPRAVPKSPLSPYFGDEHSSKRKAKQAPPAQPAPLLLPAAPTPRGIPSAPSPRCSPTLSVVDKEILIEEMAREETGRGPHTLQVGDLGRSESLCTQFRKMRLAEYFTDRGSPRFQQLGLSFAAKQNPSIKSSFGSTTDEDDKKCKGHGKKSFSARQYHLAAEAIEKDVMFCKTRNKESVQKLGASERLRTEDVRGRQLDMLFLETPEYQKYLSPGVMAVDLLPPDISKQEEVHERRKDERLNAILDDQRWSESAKQDWFMTKSEIMEVLKCARQFSRAARGANNPTGIDRSSFCRFVLEAGLVDPQYAPYLWVTSLFDAQAKPARCCPVDATWAPHASFAYVLSWWSLVSVIDAVTRQRFNSRSKAEWIRQLEPVTDKIPAALRDIQNQAATTRNSHIGAARVAAGDLSGGLTDMNPEDENGFPGAQQHVPQWLRPPERPTSTVDVSREVLQRDRLIQSMLTEPETLMITAQRSQVFEQLFECYSDGQHMPFSSMLQFCTDFRLTPALVSSAFLREAYLAARCSERIVEKPVEGPPEPSPKAEQQTPLEPASPRRPPGSKSSRSKRAKFASGRSKTNLAAAGAEHGSSNRRMSEVDHEEPQESNSPRLQKAATVEPHDHRSQSGDEDARSQSARSARSARSAPPQESRPSKESRHGSKEDVTKDKLRSPDSTNSSRVQTIERLSSCPSKDAPQEAHPMSSKEVTQRSGPGTKDKFRFGVGAYCETLLKVGLVYLHSYGNGVQRSTTAKAGTIWLLTYLHCVFDHMFQSRSRKSDFGSTRLDRVLQRVSPSVWLSPEICYSQRVSTPELAPGAVGKVEMKKRQTTHVGASGGGPDFSGDAATNGQARATVAPPVRRETVSSAGLNAVKRLATFKKSGTMKPGGGLLVDVVEKKKKSVKVDTSLLEKCYRIEDSPDAIFLSSPIRKLLDCPPEPIRNQRLDMLMEAPDVVDRIDLTPPPLGSLGEELKDRLEGMLRHKGNGPNEDEFSDDGH